jgi:beta-N-acetylhexosaminidase
MKAISGRYGMAEATVAAIGAGCDAVLMCGEDQDQQARAIEAVIRAVEDERLPITRAEDALTRHRRVKERFLGRRTAPLARAALREVLGRDEHQAVAAEMLRFA